MVLELSRGFRKIAYRDLFSIFDVVDIKIITFDLSVNIGIRTFGFEYKSNRTSTFRSLQFRGDTVS